jgi:hypothetical protein
MFVHLCADHAAVARQRTASRGVLVASAIASCIGNQDLQAARFATAHARARLVQAGVHAKVRGAHR